MTVIGSILVIAACSGLLIFVWPHKLVILLQRMSPNIVWRVQTNSRIVALSFDDGPDPVYTPLVLEELQRAGVKATFFLVGERIALYPEIARRICAEGHEIANHSQTWHRTITLSAAKFEQDLEQSDAALSQFPCHVRYFRPAGGWARGSQLAVLRKHGYVCVLGSAYAHDPMRPPARYIAWMIKRAMRPGAIIVLHDSGGDRTHSVAALPGILEHARQLDLTVGRVSDLLVSAP